MSANATPHPVARPMPVTNRRCCRCQSRSLIFVPKDGTVKCVDCTAARAIRSMLREAAK